MSVTPKAECCKVKFCSIHANHSHQSCRHDGTLEPPVDAVVLADRMLNAGEEHTRFASRDRLIKVQENLMHDTCILIVMCVQREQ